MTHLLLLLSLLNASHADEPDSAQLVEAYLRATNAHQGLLVRKSAKGDEACFGTRGMKEDALKTHVSRARGNQEDVQRLATEGPQGGASSPAEVFVRVFGKHDTPKRLPADSVRALGSLLQVALEVDRDGDFLQFLLARYHELGMPVSVSASGLKLDDASLKPLAEALSKETCTAPYDVSPRAWHIALLKVSSWGDRYAGVRNTSTVVDEMMKMREVKELLPRLKKLPRKNVVVLGHSFTMAEHWCAPSAFVPIAGEILKRAGSKLKLTQVKQGGLDAAWARNAFIDKVISMRPDRVYLVVIARTPAEHAALGDLVTRLKSKKKDAVIFDAVSFFDPYAHSSELAQEALAIAKSKGAVVVPVQKAYDRSLKGDSRRDFCLDDVHMTEGYHRFMALEWLRQDLSRLR